MKRKYLTSQEQKASKEKGISLEKIRKRKALQVGEEY
jgi:hypothetical protein